MFSFSNNWFISCTFNPQLPSSGWSGCKLTAPLIKAHVSSIQKQLPPGRTRQPRCGAGRMQPCCFQVGESCHCFLTPWSSSAPAELRWLYAELAFAFYHHILRAGTPGKKLQRCPSRRWTPLLQRDTIQELVVLRPLYIVSGNLVNAVDESTPKFHLPECTYLVEGLWQRAG